MPTLNWIGKDAVIRHHKEVPFRLLEPDEVLSHGAPDGNLIVQGDNLDALKALLPKYGGRVKCIYIDPPYNTGNEGWVYNDKVNSPEINKWLGQVVGKEAEDLSRHDKWLCMMYPRMVLLKQFLRDDGAIFVSIDDNEVASLRLLMDEVFGRCNSIATVCWQKKQSPQNDAINLSDMHDYIVVYAKRAKQNRDDPSGWSRGLIPRDEVQDARYSNPDSDPRGDWTSADYTCNKTSDERPNLYYGIQNPNTRETIHPSRTRVWAFDPDAHAKNLTEGRIWWGANGRGRPRIKKYLNEVQDGLVPTTWWIRDFAGDNQEGKKELRRLSLSGAEFATPKPTRLIQRILQIASDKDSIILDSFAGSGTTGHAVLKQNAEDGGNRKFILVEMEEKIASGITAERVRRVAGGYRDAKGKDVEGLGGGFQYCRLSAEPLFSEFGGIREDVTFAELADFVWFAETGAGRDCSPSRPNNDSPLLGVQDGRAVYLLFNGILGDRRPRGGNILTQAVLDQLTPHDGPKVVYAAATRLGTATLQRAGVVFKQTPYAIEVEGP